MKRPYRKHGGNPHHIDFPHGTFAGWKAGCRCGSCVEGNRTYQRIYMRNLRANDRGYKKRQSEDKRRYRNTPKGRAVCRTANIKRKKSVRVDTDRSLLHMIYMACPRGYEVDHIMPLSKGGKHAPDNLQYLPSAVNNQKRATLNFQCDDVAIDWRSLIGMTFNDQSASS